MKMERETGIEPATSSLGSWRSTAELLPLDTAASKMVAHRLRDLSGVIESLSAPALAAAMNQVQGVVRWFPLSQASLFPTECRAI